MQVEPSESASASSVSPKWAQQHLQEAVKEGRDWSNTFQYSEEDATKYPALNQLTPRMLDILAAQGGQPV